MKTFKDLRLSDNINEGIETLLKAEKMKNHISQDWIEHKLINFIIEQDIQADKEGEEELKKKAEKDLKKISKKEEPKKEEPKKEEPKKEEPKEGLEDILSNDGKVKGKQYITIKSLYKSINDDIRSKAPTLLYDAYYNDKILGTIKIENRELKKLAVSPYNTISCVLSITEGDINILLCATEKAEQKKEEPKKEDSKNTEIEKEGIKLQTPNESYKYSKATHIKTLKDLNENRLIVEKGDSLFSGPVGWGAVVGGLSSLFSGGKATSALGSMIFGGLFGGVADFFSKKKEKEKAEKEESEKQEKEAKENLEKARTNFAASKDEDFAGTDYDSMMQFFYKEDGTPRDIDDVRSHLDGCDPKDVQKMMNGAQKYYNENKGRCDARMQWAANLSPEEREKIEAQGKLKAEKASHEAQLKNDDKNIESLENEIEKLQGKDDEVSKKTLQKMQEELDAKKAHRKETADKLSECNKKIEAGTKEIANIHQPTEKELDDAQRKEEKKTASQLNTEAKKIQDMINSGKDENRNKLTETDKVKMQKKVQDLKKRALEVYYDGDKENPEYKEKLQEIQDETSRVVLQNMQGEIDGARNELNDAIDSGDQERIRKAQEKMNEITDRLNEIDPENPTIKSIAEKNQKYNTRVENNQKIKNLNSEIENETDPIEKRKKEEQFIELRAQNAELAKPGEGAKVRKEYRQKLIDNDKARTKKATEEAQKEYQEAVESGDSEKIAEARSRLVKAKTEQKIADGSKILADGTVDKYQLTSADFESLTHDMDETEKKAKEERDKKQNDKDEKEFMNLKRKSQEAGFTEEDSKRLQELRTSIYNRKYKEAKTDAEKEELAKSLGIKSEEVSSFEDAAEKAEKDAAQKKVDSIKSQLEDRNLSPEDRCRLKGELFDAEINVQRIQAKYDPTSDAAKKFNSKYGTEEKLAEARAEKSQEWTSEYSATKAAEKESNERQELKNEEYRLSNWPKNDDGTYKEVDGVKYEDAVSAYSSKYKQLYKDVPEVKDGTWKFEPKQDPDTAINAAKARSVRATERLSEITDKDSIEYAEAEKEKLMADAEKKLAEAEKTKDAKAIAEAKERLNQTRKDCDKKINSRKDTVDKGTVELFEEKFGGELNKEELAKLSNEEKAEYEASIGKYLEARKNITDREIEKWKQENPGDKDKSPAAIAAAIAASKSGKEAERLAREAAVAKQKKEENKDKIKSKVDALEAKMKVLKSVDPIDATKYAAAKAEVEKLQKEIKDLYGDVPEELSTIPSQAELITAKAHEQSVKNIINDITQEAANTTTEDANKTLESSITQKKRDLLKAYGVNLEGKDDSELDDLIKNNIDSDTAKKFNDAISEARKIASAKIDATNNGYKAASTDPKSKIDMLGDEKVEFGEGDNKKTLTMKEIHQNLVDGLHADGSKIEEGDELSEDDKKYRGQIDTFLGDSKVTKFSDAVTKYNDKVKQEGVEKANKIAEKEAQWRQLTAKLDKGEELKGKDLKDFEDLQEWGKKNGHDDWKDRKNNKAASTTEPQAKKGWDKLNDEKYKIGDKEKTLKEWQDEINTKRSEGKELSEDEQKLIIAISNFGQDDKKTFEEQMTAATNTWNEADSEKRQKETTKALHEATIKRLKSKVEAGDELSTDDQHAWNQAVEWGKKNGHTEWKDIKKQESTPEDEYKLSETQLQRRDFLARGKEELSDDEIAELNVLNGIVSKNIKASDYDSALETEKQNVAENTRKEKERLTREAQIYADIQKYGKDDPTVKADLERFNKDYPNAKYDSQKYINDELVDLRSKSHKEDDGSVENAEVKIDGETVSIKVQKKTGKRGGKYFRTKRGDHDWSDWQNGEFNPKRYNESLLNTKSNITEFKLGKGRIKTLKEMRG